MSQTEPKYRKKLNDQQLEVLELLYRFRFGSSELVAKYSGKQHGMDVYRRMRILEDQGLIGKRYDSSYKIRGRPAAYYLLPAGARALTQRASFGNKDYINVNSLYKDKDVQEPFIDHSLSIFAIHIQLKFLYSLLQLFTKRQLAVYEYFPNPLPDTYMSLKVDGEVRRFFLELYEASIPRFVVDRRLRKLIQYCEEGDWPEDGGSFPTMLCVCETDAQERQLRRQISRVLYKSGEDILFHTTTKAALLGATKKDKEIWTNTAELDELYSLSSLDVNP